MYVLEPKNICEILIIQTDSLFRKSKICIE